jgi:L-threonylcarbamoyladenylate synthase
MKMNAEILPTHTAALFDAAVRRATELLRAGEVVALPTETVYGLAANALEAAAVARIYEIKGRPAHNPVIVHVAGREMARRCCRDWPALADRLADAFWPGPLTLVLERSDLIPEAVTAGGGTVGVRWPGHPFIQAVIRACGFPLAAPSANPANQVSPTNAEHVRRTLGDRVALIVDGGQSQVGIESTVLDVTARPPRLLRPGMIHEESLVAVTGELAVGDGAESATLRSPGLLRKHYAPRARLQVLTWCDEADLGRQLAGTSVAGERVHVIAHTHIPLGGGFARAIYGELHACDEAGAEWIVVEAPPEGPEWRAIDDRLRRASA